MKYKTFLSTVTIKQIDIFIFKQLHNIILFITNIMENLNKLNQLECIAFYMNVKLLNSYKMRVHYT